MHGQMDVGSPQEYIDGLDEPRRSQIAQIDSLIRETAPQLTPHIRGGVLAYGSYHYTVCERARG